MWLRYWLILILASLLAVADFPVKAQPFGQTRSRINNDVQFDHVDSSVRAHLTRVEAFLAEEQWEEAVNTLRRVMVESGDQLIERLPTDQQPVKNVDGSASSNFIPVKQWVHHRLAALATEAPPVLTLYRGQVDEVASHLYEQGLATRDEDLLRQIVDDLFCSRHGDDALAILGELALERGDFASARHCWERISPTLRFTPPKAKDASPTISSAESLSYWHAHRHWPDLAFEDRQPNQADFWSFPFYPDTNLDVVNIQAQLVMVSILEGNNKRAQWELERFKKAHPQATGKIYGREVKLAAQLEQWLKGSLADKTSAVGQGGQVDWPTFGGSPQRGNIANGDIDLAGEPLWSITLGLGSETDDTTWLRSGLGPRVAEQPDALLSTFPIVTADGTLIFSDQALPEAVDFSLPKLVSRIRAFDLSTGKPKWPRQRAEATTNADSGVVFQTRPFTAWQRDRQRFGVPRFSMTQHGAFAFARLGPQQTTQPKDDTFADSSGVLLAIDLSQQGKLLWQPIEPEDGFAFEGAPLCDGQFLYVAQRGNQTPPKSYIACFDLKTGSRRWRTAISSADTPALGRREEITHNLLTLAEDKLFLNTNLGAIAAVSASNGDLLWLTTYDRATDDPSQAAVPPTHFGRDMNPCVYWQGMVFAAPSDSEHLLAFDAMTGQMIWTAAPRDVVHLLGVGQGNLIASGHRLWWIDAVTGETQNRYPDSAAAQPKGWGRGVLAGKQILWPTHEHIYVFDQRTSRLLRQPIDLARRGLTGGNLVVAGDYLLISTHDRIHAFGKPP